MLLPQTHLIMCLRHQHFTKNSIIVFNKCIALNLKGKYSYSVVPESDSYNAIVVPAQFDGGAAQKPHRAVI